jgi:hypothetical protein
MSVDKSLSIKKIDPKTIKAKSKVRDGKEKLLDQSNAEHELLLNALTGAQEPTLKVDAQAPKISLKKPKKLRIQDDEDTEFDAGPLTLNASAAANSSEENIDKSFLVASTQTDGFLVSDASLVKCYIRWEACRGTAWDRDQ